MKDAEGEFPWITRFLNRLREHGWSFKRCRQGVVIRPPKWTRIYGQTNCITESMFDELRREMSERDLEALTPPSLSSSRTRFP